VRDAGLLESALARPRQIAAYGDNTDVSDLAAAYTAGLVKNHPFLRVRDSPGISVHAASWKVCILLVS